MTTDDLRQKWQDTRARVREEKEAEPARKRYVQLYRDAWGIARRFAESCDLTEAEAQEKDLAMRQMHMGWLVPEDEVHLYLLRERPY